MAAKEERGGVAALRRTSDDAGNAELAHNSPRELDSAGCPKGEGHRPESKAGAAYTIPPSTTRHCPVMYEAAGMQRNAATAATSSGFPILFIGVRARTAER